MRWLLYGHRGWIGGQLVKILENQGEMVIGGESRVDNYDSTLAEIQRINPERVICTIGRTSGPNCPNIDYLEQDGKLVENLRDNLHGPINLANICRGLDLHLTYLSTGCIYEFDETHPMNSYQGHGFTENDAPNFTGSSYSCVKGVTDQLMKGFENVLNARIRMPISDEINPRNFITNITQYKKIVSIPNSMTVLPELMPIMIDMAKQSRTGTINLTNPGVISHQEILDFYKQYVDSNFTYELIDSSELKNYVVARRSNNYLETNLLENYYKVTPIKEAVKNVLIKMAKTN